MELNAIGLKCPMPIVRLGQTLKKAQVGEQISIVSDDAAFPADLRAWCKQTGHTLVSLDDSDPRRCVAVVKKEK